MSLQHKLSVAALAWYRCHALRVEASGAKRKADLAARNASCFSQERALASEAAKQVALASKAERRARQALIKACKACSQPAEDVVCTSEKVKPLQLDIAEALMSKPHQSNDRSQHHES